MTGNVITKTRRAIKIGNENSCFNEEDEKLLRFKKNRTLNPVESLKESFNRRHQKEFGKEVIFDKTYRNEKGKPTKVVVSLTKAFLQYTFSGTGFTEFEALQVAVEKAMAKWPIKKSKKEKRNGFQKIIKIFAKKAPAKKQQRVA